MEINTSSMFLRWVFEYSDYNPRYERTNSLEEYGISMADFMNQYEIEMIKDAQEYLAKNSHKLAEITAHYVKYCEVAIASYQAEIAQFSPKS